MQHALGIMIRLRPIVLGLLVPLTCAAAGCASPTEESTAATDDQGETSALTGTSDATCSDSELKRQFSSLNGSSASRRHDEIGANAHAIVADLVVMLHETVKGDDRCGPAITERTNELVGRADCLYRAVDAAFDLQGVLATEVYRTSQAQVDEALRSKSDLRQYEIPPAGTDCSSGNRVEYLETLQKARVKFGVAKAFDGYKHTAN